jgi:hypothetical protein
MAAPLKLPPVVMSCSHRLASERATVLKMGQISEKSFPKEAATGEKTKSGSQTASL